MSSGRQAGRHETFDFFVSQFIPLHIAPFRNFLVFMRPKYMKQRRLNPNVSRWVAMKRAFTAGQLARGVTSAAATQQSRAPRSVNTSVSIEQSVESADFPTECEAKEASPQLLLLT